MPLDKFKPKEESQSNSNVFKDTRLLMALAMLTVLSSGCNPLNPETNDDDQDLAGIQDDSDPSEVSADYLIPAVEEENDIITCEELPIDDAGVEEEKESFEELVKRVDKVLKFGVPYQLGEKIDRVRSKNVCYAGDSYMVGIVHEGKRKVKEKNVQAEIGRQFVSDGENGVEDDIEKYAVEAIENPNCKLLILNGGFNDLMNDGSEETYNRVLAGYNRILEAIRERVGEGDGSFEVIYYDIPITPKKGKEMGRVNAYATRLNNYMAEQGDVRVIKTSEHIKKWRKDKMHPKTRGYKRLFGEIKRFIN